MKAIRYEEFGGPEVLQYVDIDEPACGPGQVRVALTAAGVNPVECYIRTGTYAAYKPDLPHVPGFDGAGTVTEVGEGATGVTVGQRVFVASMLSAVRTGTYAEQVVCSADGVFPLPDGVSEAQGAGLGVPATTAYRALFQRGRLAAGETVLVHGASGAVGLLAVQLAVAAGATVVGSASSEAGRSAVLAAGAAGVIDHGDVAGVKDLAGSAPDLVLEMLADKNLTTDLEGLARYGRIVVIGTRGTLDFNPRLAMGKEADVLGTAQWNTPPDEWAQASRAVADALAAGTLRPVVGKSYPLSEAQQAQTDILSGGAAAGRVILEI